MIADIPRMNKITKIRSDYFSTEKFVRNLFRITFVMRLIGGKKDYFFTKSTLYLVFRKIKLMTS